MNIERTDLGQQEFDQHTGSLTAHETYRRVIQQILGENPPHDPLAREDEVFYGLGELVEKDLITSDEYFDYYSRFIESERSVAKVIYLGIRIAKPFRE